MPVLTVDQIIGNPNVVNFAVNQNVQAQYQNNYALQHIALRLTGSAVLSGYSAAPSKYVESIENLVAAFQLVATGNTTNAVTDQLCNVDFALLRTKTRLMEGTDVVRTDVGTANGTYLFETNVKKYFVDPRSNNAALSTMFTNLLSSLTASFQFRDATALVTGGTGGTATVTAAQITAQARMALGWVPPNPSPYIRETQRTATIAAAQNGLRIPNVPCGNVLRRQYIKGTIGNVPFADPSDSVFAATGKPEGPHVQFSINNTVTKLDQVYGQLRNDNKLLFGVESMPTGYCVYEPARNRKISASVPLGGAANADNYVDVGFTSGSINTLQITDEQLVKLSAAQWNAN